MLGSRARIVTRCAPADRRLLLSRVVALGLPVAWEPAVETTSFSFRYEREQLSYALTPSVLRHLLAHGFERV